MPAQHIPFWQFCPGAQHWMPHTVVPCWQQPPTPLGTPLQHMFPAHTAPCWQHTPPQTTPEEQQTPLVHPVPAAQHEVPQGVCPAAQQPPPTRTLPLGQHERVTESHCSAFEVQQVAPHANWRLLQQVWLSLLQNSSGAQHAFPHRSPVQHAPLMQGTPGGHAVVPH